MSEGKNGREDYLINKIFDKCKEAFYEKNINDIDAAYSIISKIIDTSDDYPRALWRIHNDLNDKYPLLFNCIPPELFLVIIQHLRTIASQKIESRNIGVKIVVFMEDPKSSFIGYSVQSQRIKLQEKITGAQVDQHFKDYTKKLQRIYKCVDSSNAFFAYTSNKNGELIYNGIKKFDSQNNHLEAICCDNERIGFELKNGFINIYFNSKIIMDYYLSETSGNWIPRYTIDLVNTLKQLIQLGSDNAEDYWLLAKVIMKLSHIGKGAMLIITASPDTVSTNFSIPCDKSIESLKQAEKDGTIYSFAVYDGAVIIQNVPPKQLKVCNFGVVLDPKSDIGKDDDYYLLLQYSNSGSRHEKAVKHAYDNPDDCIIVISENRSISILKGKTPILWRDDCVDGEMLTKLRNEEVK